MRIPGIAGQAGWPRRSLMHRDLCEGRLVCLSPIEPPYPDAYWLVWPLRLESAPKIAKLRSWLRQEIAGYLANIATSGD